MKKGAKIAWLIILGFIAVFTALLIALNISIDRLVTDKINTAFDNCDTLSLHVDNVKVFPLSGYISLEDVEFRLGREPKDDKPYVHTLVTVDRVWISSIAYRNLLLKKELLAKDIHVQHPHAQVFISEKPIPRATPATQRHRMTSQEAQQAEQMRLEIQKEQERHQKSAIAILQHFLKRFVLDQMTIERAELTMSSIYSKMQIHVDSVDILLGSMGYSLVDSIPFQYNDSAYDLYVGPAEVIVPDGLTKITIDHIQHTNGGPITIGTTHIWNTVNKWKMADMMGDIPTTWIDMTVGEVRTSPFNAFAQIDKTGFDMDSIIINVEKMHVFRDMRNPCKEEQPMPQEALLGLTYPFHIKNVLANIKRINVEMTLADHNAGTLTLNSIQSHVKNITADKDAVISANVKGRMGHGRMNMNFRMHINKACNWDIDLKAKDVRGEDLDKFLYPLMAMNVKCNIHNLTTKYSGDSKNANGTFLMEYDGLKVHVDPKGTPSYKIIHNLAGGINGFVEMFVPKANPYMKGKDPVGYKVSWKHDKMQSAEQFFVGPLIDGVIETMLPGLFLIRRDKAPKDASKEKAVSIAKTHKNNLTKKQKNQL